MKIMRKKIYLFFVSFVISGAIYAQNDQNTPADRVQDSIKKAEGKKPVDEVWGCTMLVDNQTSLIPTKGHLELLIQHRFSNLENGIHDLFGLYGASNIRIAMQYSIIDQLMVGFSTEKDNKYQEFYAKGNIMEQSQNGCRPFSITLFGNAVISGQPKSYYGVDSTYKFKDRMSYFAQLIIARKFCNAFSLEAGISYSHVNKVESQKFVDTVGTAISTSYKPIYNHDIIGISAGARIRFHNYSSFLLEYDQGFFATTGQYEMLFPKPNLALAYELATPTHCFQVFVSSYRGLNPEQNFVKNQFDFTKKLGIMLGFNITVRLR
jgi:hypothetical protein